MDRAQLADFLQRRRRALQPEDVGLGRGPRRRTAGLRREEVAALSDMSVDYYSRLEQSRGPRPSEQMLMSIARGLRLTQDERDHLFRLAGHSVPARTAPSSHVAPGLMRILDRLQDTPAKVLTELGETLVQTPPARTLFVDETRYTGLARSAVYRWFTDPRSRDVYPAADHDNQSRNLVAGVRVVAAQHGAGTRAAEIVDALLEESDEFAALWSEHEVRTTHSYEKRVQHPEVGVIDVQCQRLVDPEQNHMLLVFTATPGTDSYDKLQLLSLIDATVITGPHPSP